MFRLKCEGEGGGVNAHKLGKERARIAHADKMLLGRAQKVWRRGKYARKKGA